MTADVLPLAPWALTALVAALVALVTGGPAIGYLRVLKFGQAIREEGPQSHKAKAGTPTMGGWLILFPALVAYLAAVAWYGLVPSGGRGLDAWLDGLVACAVTFAYGGLGFLDDWLIIKKKSNKGLAPRLKLLGQVGIAVLFAAYLFASGHGTWTLVPVLHAKLALGPLYYALVVLVLAATSNAVNLTDGLDALATGVSIPAFLALAVLMSRHAYLAGHSAIGATLWLVALVGGGLGFLWFNGHPALVFMGDTGSLALGGALGACAILGHLELYLIPLGGVFLAETLSVMIQVAYFKRTGGKRIFRMSPLHHHFELGGLPETKVVIRFQLVGALLALASVSLL